MTIDELLERYGQLMHEAGVVKGELAVMLRFAQSLKDLPDNQTKVHVDVSIPTTANRDNMVRTPYRSVALKVVAAIDKPFKIPEAFAEAKKHFPHYEMTLHNFSSTMMNLVRDGKIRKVEKGIYQRLDGMNE